MFHSSCENWLRHWRYEPISALLEPRGNDATVKLWDVRTGKRLQTLRGHLDWVRSVAFSPNDSRLVSSSDDGKVRIWNLEFLGQ
jgi:WD40 repeat protein